MSDATHEANVGTDAWKTAVRLQQAAPPNHSDFYTLCGELMETLRALEQLAWLLAGQVENYGQGRVLRDDEGEDPATRLAMAAAQVSELGRLLDQADCVAGQAWSEVGHIGLVEPAAVEVETGEGAG